MLPFVSLCLTSYAFIFFLFFWLRFTPIYSNLLHVFSCIENIKSAYTLHSLFIDLFHFIFNIPDPRLTQNQLIAHFNSWLLTTHISITTQTKVDPES